MYLVNRQTCFSQFIVKDTVLIWAILQNWCKQLPHKQKKTHLKIIQILFTKILLISIKQYYLKYQ